jgi:outer membrane receptor protein involved in Fe transport
MKRAIYQVSMAAIGVVILGINTDVKAQETSERANFLEEVIVTASRREQSTLDVSASLSAMTGDLLESIGAEDLDGYFGFVPSVTTAHNMVGERGGQNIVVRGISNSRASSGFDASLAGTTGFYINDIPATPVDTQLIDINRIEVLRGPQGTLYGAASMGGAIKVYYNKPNLNEIEGQVEAEYLWMKTGGTGYLVSGVVNLPIVEGVFGLRFVGSNRSRDGFINTVITPLDVTTPNTSYPPNDFVGYVEGNIPGLLLDANSMETSGARLSALYEPSEQLSIEASILWQDATTDDLTLFNREYSGERIQEKYTLEPTDIEMTLSSVNVTYDFGNVLLTSETGYLTRKYLETLDYTPIYYGTYASKLDYVPATGILSTGINFNTVTQEIRLQSNKSESDDSFFGRLNWVTGLFYMDESRDIPQLQIAPGWEAAAPNNPLPVVQDMNGFSKNNADDKSKAFYFDFTYDLTEDLAVSAGARYYDLETSLHREILSASSPVVPRISDVSHAEDGWSPKVSIDYSFSDNVKAYGSYAQGFRLGGAATAIDSTSSQACQNVVADNNLQAFASGSFDSDSVETYELGMKMLLADGRARIDASVYTTDWSDLQQQVRMANFPGSLCTSILTANVGSATVDGVELETSFAVTDRLSMRATLSYTNAEIDDPGSVGVLVQTGDRIQNVPEWSGSLAADYVIPTSALGGGEFLFHGDVRYMDDRTPEVGEPSNPELLLASYTLVALRAAYSFGERPVTVTLFIDNVFDEIVEFNARSRVGYSSNTIVSTGMPRTIGLNVRKEF